MLQARILALGELPSVSLMTCLSSPSSKASATHAKPTKQKVLTWFQDPNFIGRDNDDSSVAGIVKEWGRTNRRTVRASDDICVAFARETRRYLVNER